MLLLDSSRKRRAPLLALAVSAVFHALLLLISPGEPATGKHLPRLEASLAPRLPAPAPLPEKIGTPPRPAKAGKKPAPRPRLLTAEKASRPTWSVAERREMADFLGELSMPAQAAPPESLARRSLAMAGEVGRQLAQRAASEAATLELRPNAPPADPFSLDLYVDGLVRRLNRSAAFVRNDPRSQGVRTAAVQFRLNPDGSLKSFAVLNMGDQAGEIAFIRSVVERSIPFAPFPPDIDRAARSLAMTICIIPGGGSGGFGFTRHGDGRGC